MNYTDRYRQLARQRAYRRSIAAQGLPALLEPYTLHTARLPQQRHAVSTNRATHAL